MEVGDRGQLQRIEKSTNGCGQAQVQTAFRNECFINILGHSDDNISFWFNPTYSFIWNPRLRQPFKSL